MPTITQIYQRDVFTKQYIHTQTRTHTHTHQCGNFVSAAMNTTYSVWCMRLYFPKIIYIVKQTYYKQRKQCASWMWRKKKTCLAENEWKNMENSLDRNLLCVDAWWNSNLRFFLLLSELLLFAKRILLNRRWMKTKIRDKF